MTIPELEEKVGLQSIGLASWFKDAVKMIHAAEKALIAETDGQLSGKEAREAIEAQYREMK